MECHKVPQIEDFCCSQIIFKPPTILVDIESFESIYVDGLECKIQSVVKDNSALVITFEMAGARGSREILINDPSVISAYESYKKKKNGI